MEGALAAIAPMAPLAERLDSFAGSYRPINSLAHRQKDSPTSVMICAEISEKRAYSP
jgi:hypothetical protein